MAAMRTAANRMACCFSDILKATARPPSERERNGDGNHRGDHDRDAQIYPRRERGGHGDRGRDRLAERVDMTVVAWREHDAVPDHPGAEDVLGRGGLERPDQGPARRGHGTDGPNAAMRREEHLVVRIG